MKILVKWIILTSLILTSFQSLFAITWDEPWQDEIIKEADCFILAKVVAVDKEKGIKVKVLKDFNNVLEKDKIAINGFYLLNICSRSAGHGPEFDFKKGKEYYFFLKKGKDNDFLIATPTSGFAAVIENGILATYRHSYHQAIVQKETYEKSMLAIFNKYKNKSYDTTWVNNSIKKYLNQEPSGEHPLFFDQHVALEMIYHLELNIEFSLIKPFLTNKNYHLVLSAIRSLYHNTTKERTSALLNYIDSKEGIPFAKVLAIWAISNKGYNSLDQKQLKSLKKTALKDKEDYDSGFGGNIMDPRICTHFPYVKSAIEKLLEKIKN